MIAKIYIFAIKKSNAIVPTIIDLLEKIKWLLLRASIVRITIITNVIIERNNNS